MKIQDANFMLTWRGLLEDSPELAELKASAVSIAQNEKSPWFERWLFNSTSFQDAVTKAADRLHVPRQELRDVAYEGLLDAYRVAKRRKHRERAPG